jgi:hypothetical protein
MIMAIIAAVGLGTAAYGMMKGKKAGDSANAANAAATQASIRAEQLRLQQMRLEARRQRRETVRQMMLARATGASAAANSGAMESSGFAGGQAQAIGLGGQKLVASTENEGIGEGLFNANVDKANAEQRLFRARTKQQEAQGLTSLGMSLMSNASGITKNFNSTFGTSA